MPSTKEASTVVTGENRADFMAKVLKLDAPAPAPEVKEPIPGDKIETEPEKADATAKTEEKKDPLQKRFDELTFQREEAKREAQREKEAAAKEREAVAKEREARLKAEQEAAALKAKYEPPKDPDPKPTKEQFKDEAEFQLALEEWITDKANRERDAREAQAQRVKAWNERVKTTQAKFPDFQEVVNAADLKVSDQMRDAIVESEIGPELQYFFAKNPDEANRLGQMSVRGMLIAMGKLEAKLADKPETKSEPKVEPKAEPKSEPKSEPVAEISKAPAPETPLKGANAPAALPIDSAGEFVGDYQTWKALRKAKKV